MAVRTSNPPWEPSSIDYLALVFVLDRKHGHKLSYCAAFDHMDAAMKAANCLREGEDKPAVEVWVWHTNDGVFRTRAQCVCYSSGDNQAWHHALGAETFFA